MGKCNICDRDYGRRCCSSCFECDNMDCYLCERCCKYRSLMKIENGKFDIIKNLNGKIIKKSLYTFMENMRVEMKCGVNVKTYLKDGKRIIELENKNE